MWTLLFAILYLSWSVSPQLIHVSKDDLAKVRAQESLQKSTEQDKISSDTLILTPYIEFGKLKKARKLSRVRGGPFPDDVLSYSGYFTVEKELDSNLFFWFFPAENNYENAPVILWLQGGPGASSMFGLFTEIGPYRVEEDDATVSKIPYSWTTNHSVLFIDNPVGTECAGLLLKCTSLFEWSGRVNNCQSYILKAEDRGDASFSFTGPPSGYSTNQNHVGSNLYEALIQFFTLFHELQNNDFYVSGESYAGKYIPTIGYTIHKRNPNASIKINLKGLFIGNGLSDPIHMLHYSDFLYQIGLIDSKSKDEIKSIEDQGRELISLGDYESASYAWNGALQMLGSIINYNNLYNFLYNEEPPIGGSLKSFFNRKDVRQALHVGNTKFTEINYEVYYHMRSDLMDTVRPWVEELINSGYRVMYYSGQLDIIVAYAISVPYYNILEFDMAEQYKSAARNAWYVDGELAGYIKRAGNFSEVLVRNAGHMVPTDQPKWALALLDKFITNSY